MIELSLELIDRLIALARERKAVKEKRLEIVRAMYGDLTRIHTNYIEVLESIRSELTNGNDMVAVFRHVAQESHKLEPLRRSTMAVAETLAAEPRLERVKPFFDSVSDYFLRANPRERSTPFSYVTSLANHIQRGADDRAFRQHMSELIGGCLEGARREWMRVSTEYGKLIAKAVS